MVHASLAAKGENRIRIFTAKTESNLVFTCLPHNKSVLGTYCNKGSHWGNEWRNWHFL